ncbi:hypothetical protein Glove_407g10 [Diversispora epigaea]|uniref:Uncharacterized protein n=1 Tax=Diversispora epigaea TaxID=1348612 RepID=A0A397GYP1_9GLOM|nr:hypothetical protein Glove_407g10 [Diversispora epigaea]
MRYVQGLSRAFSFKIGEYRFNSGNNAYNAISIWKVDEQADEITILQKNKRIITKPSSLRIIYRMLTGDTSSAETVNEAKIDERVRIALDLGDPEITIDLPQFLEGKAADAVTAVDERRHDLIVHLATAISVNDLLYQIERECPPGTAIPSAQWL